MPLFPLVIVFSAPSIFLTSENSLESTTTKTIFFFFSLFLSSSRHFSHTHTQTNNNESKKNHFKSKHNNSIWRKILELVTVISWFGHTHPTKKQKKRNSFSLTISICWFFCDFWVNFLKFYLHQQDQGVTKRQSFNVTIIDAGKKNRILHTKVTHYAII